MTNHTPENCGGSGRVLKSAPNAGNVKGDGTLLQPGEPGYVNGAGEIELPCKGCDHPDCPNRVEAGVDAGDASSPDRVEPTDSLRVFGETASVDSSPDQGGDAHVSEPANPISDRARGTQDRHVGGAAVEGDSGPETSERAAPNQPQEEATEWPEVELAIDVLDDPPRPFFARVLDEAGGDWRNDDDYRTATYVPKDKYEKELGEARQIRENLWRHIDRAERRANAAEYLLRDGFGDGPTNQFKEAFSEHEKRAEALEEKLADLHKALEEPFHTLASTIGRARVLTKPAHAKGREAELKSAAEAMDRMSAALNASKADSGGKK